MLDEWSKIIILIGAAGIIGYLAQKTGLCMVRGVLEFRKGRPMLILALLLCGICALAILPLAASLGLNTSLPRYEWHYFFALGGLIFGLGSSANGGCAISTMSRLAQGEITMIATMVGWVTGWCLWALWIPDGYQPTPIGGASDLTIILEVIALSIATIWAVTHSPQGRKLWLSVMAIGLVAGLLFALQPHWSPSYLLQDFARVTLHNETGRWPTNDRFVILIALLSGMFIAAWLSHHFVLKAIHFSDLMIHLVAGTAMGIGAAMSLGGNDTQLLIAMPGFSPGGVVAVIFILLGIYIGSLVPQPATLTKKDVTTN